MIDGPKQDLVISCHGEKHRTAGRPGDVMVFPASSMVEVVSSPGVATVAVLFIPPWMVYEAAGGRLVRSMPLMLPFRDEYIAAEVRRVAQCDDFDSVDILPAVRSVAARLERILSGGGWVGERIDAVRRGVDIRRPVSLADAAKIAGLSVSHFRREWAAAVGMPFHQWLIRKRCEAARDLLATRMPLADIADQVGFGSQASFTRAFSATFGMPPGVFRRKS